MFSRFKITAENLRYYVLDFRHEQVRDRYSIDSRSVLERVQNVIMAASQDGVVNADILKEGFFPTAFRKRYQVFISHSHKDIDLVKRLANVLYARFGVRCFVDSMVWENMTDLLKALDEQYCRRPLCGYDYNKRNMSTAHVHAMLSIALLEMIEQCECCIFVQSENSIIPSLKLKGISDEDKTFSPWIYEEINYMNMLQPHLSQRLIKLFSVLDESERTDYIEQMVPSLPIAHGINLDKFTEVKSKDLPYILSEGKSWLDILYEKTQYIRKNDFNIL